MVHRDSSGGIHDLTPGVDSGLNVRTLVHEYGGGDFLVGEDAVYFANFKRVFSSPLQLFDCS